jgi:hypothetical protein
MYFSHIIKKVIKFKVNGAHIAEGICHDQRDITHITGIGWFITDKRTITGVTRGVTDKVDCIFLAEFHTVTVIAIIQAGIIPPYTEAVLAFINLGTVEAVITGSSVIRMGTASRTITGIIGTYIPVIATGRP